MTTGTVPQNPDEQESRLPIGKRLSKKSAKVEFPSPVVAVSGIHRASGMVYSTRPYGTVVWQQVVQRNPDTPFQQLRRIARGVILNSWVEVPAEERDAWGRYALDEGLSHPETSVHQAGYTQWVRAMTYRFPMLGTLSLTAPVDVVPGPILEIEQLAPPDEESFAFRVRHANPAGSQARLLVELTPPTPTLKRSPDEGDLVWFAPSDPDSFLSLGADGTVYVLSGVRTPVETGRRYGVRMTLISADGVPGPRLRADFVKLPPEPGALSS